jgi:predicted nucleic acid-binding protein
VDTNILLRYLMADHPQHSHAAKRLMEEAGTGKIQLEIPLVAVMETVFTLQSFYRVPREDIGRELLKVLTAPGTKLAGPGWLLGAVDEFRSRNISFGDACIAAEARQENLPVASFDKDLDSFPGIKRFEPK